MAVPLVALAGIAQLAGGLLGGILGSADKQKAKDLADQAYAELINSGMPPDQSKEIIMQKFQEAGILSPDLEQHVALGPSKVAGISEDGSLRDAQTGALQKLQQVSRGGLRPEDRAAYNQLRNEGNQALQGKIGQIQQGFQSRGQGGQGAELAAMLSASQEGANRASQQGDQISADASRRALEALGTSGQMAGQIRGQDFDVARTKANAEDEFARFNAQNAMAIQSRNIAAKNAAQLQNLQSKQNVMNANTTQANNELLRQKQAERQYYADQVARHKMISDAKMNQSNVYAGSAANTAQNWQSIGAGAGGFLNNMNADQQAQQAQDKYYQNQQTWQDLLKRQNAAAIPQASAAIAPEPKKPSNIYNPQKPWSF
jgi:hypothetical protein